MKGSVGHNSSCGEKENGHPTSRIMCILQNLSLWSSQRQHPSSRQLYRTVCDFRPYTTVTIRRPRRLRKRQHPIPYKNKPIPSNVRLDILSDRLDKEICARDSCSTIEPDIQICKQKEGLKSMEFNNSNELDSVLPELFIGGTCCSNCGYPFPPSVNKLSTFIHHVLEIIEEADVETREQVEGFR